MKPTALLSTLALAALTAGACLPGQAQTSARAGVQTGAPAATQMTPVAGAPTPQQAQKAQENRSDAEAYLQRAEARTTGSSSASSGRADLNPGTPGQASGAGVGASTRAGTPATTPTVPTADAPPPYGPVLQARQPQAGNAARQDGTTQR